MNPAAPTFQHLHEGMGLSPPNDTGDEGKAVLLCRIDALEVPPLEEGRPLVSGSTVVALRMQGVAQEPGHLAG